MSDLPPPLPGTAPPNPPPAPPGDPTELPRTPGRPEAAPAPAGENRFPCQSCGADLRYRPGTDDLACSHCGAVTPIGGAGQSGSAHAELDLRDALSDSLPPAAMQELRTTHCPNCGAVVEFAGADHATECPFCATPVVVDTGTHRQIKPRGLLPFAFDEAEARRRLTDWLGSLWFAPNGVKDYARKGREMDGIYVPYWTFDADTSSDYTGERGDAYYVTRTVYRNGKATTVSERRIRWSARSGRVTRFFDNVLVVASRSLPKVYVDRLEPWDLEDLRDYRPEYLAGFRAEGYTVELDAGYAEAKGIMDKVIREDVRHDIGGDEQRIHSVETQFRDVTFRHLLLPIYLAAYRYSGNSYRFVVNARTGEVQGERPYSTWKIALAATAGLIVAGIVAWFYLQNR